MNDIQLRSLMALKEHGSFGRAAEKMFLSKQALKKQMDTLEGELGFTLFVRTSHGTVLTEAGEEFCRYASQALNILTEGVTRSRNISLESHIIRIENPRHPRILLQDAIQAFSARYPDIHMEVRMGDNSKGIEHILDGSADIVELVERKDVLSKEISFTTITRLSYSCLVAPNHPLAKKERIEIEDLSGNTIGLSHIAHNQEIYNQICSRCNHVTILDCTENTMQDVFNICYNQGIYLTKAYFASAMQPLSKIPLNTSLGKACGIYYRSNPTPVVQAFIELVKEMYPSKSSG